MSLLSTGTKAQNPAQAGCLCLVVTNIFLVVTRKISRPRLSYSHWYANILPTGTSIKKCQAVGVFLSCALTPTLRYLTLWKPTVFQRSLRLLPSSTGKLEFSRPLSCSIRSKGVNKNTLIRVYYFVPLLRIERGSIP